MPKCRTYREWILEALSGDLAPEQNDAVERHLAECPACRSHYSETRIALKSMNLRGNYDPGEDFWNNYWDRLQARMAAEGSPENAVVRPRPTKSRSLFGLPSWVPLAVAATALLTIGIFIGRNVHQPEFQAGKFGSSGSSVVLPAAVSPDLSGRTSHYLERSKRVLLTVVNFTTDPKDLYGLNLPAQRKASEALVREAAALKTELRESKERQLERLVGELERILLQIANLDEGDGLAAVDIIKAGAESSDILFKIDLAEIKAAPKGSGSPRRLTGSVS